MSETPQTTPEENSGTVVNITPGESEIVPITFNIAGFGKFDLPVLGIKSTPYGISSAFAIWQSVDKNNAQAVAGAWGHLSQALANLYPDAVRVLSRLDGDTVAQVFQAWSDQSKGYNPKAPSSPA